MPSDEAPYHVLGEEKAPAIFQNCMVLAHKTDFYVGAGGDLEGYRWINFPCRVILWIKNWLSGGKITADTVRKIEETFKFILGIRSQIYKLMPTSFYEGDSIKFYNTYTDIATKVMRKYPRKDFETLYRLAQRILHERSMDICITIDGTQQTRRNCAECAKGTSYEKTTLWGIHGE